MPPVRRNSRGEVTEKELLTATMDQVRRFGYDKATISGIARAAGKPASSVYWMFENKDELITRALEASYPAATLAEQWGKFDKEQPIADQLEVNIAKVLAKSVREESVRTGIMLALEGAAAELPVQKPFRTRRSATLAALQLWWREALNCDEEGARRMGALTMWFLDGHFVGDWDDVGTLAKVKTRLLARALIAAAESSFVAAPAPQPPAVVPCIESRAFDESDADLLAVTRHLLAEHGYEGATIARICEASGMKRSSVYWRHKDKDSLVKAAVAEQFLDVMGRLPHLPEPEGLGAEGAAQVLARDMAELPVRAGWDPALMRAGLLIAVQRFEPPTACGETLIASTREILARLSRWYEQAVGCDEAMAQLVAWLFTRLRMGIIVGGVLDGDRVIVDEEMAAVMFGRLLGNLPARGIDV